MTDRTIRAVPPGYLTAEEDLPAFTYLPESDLPPLLAEEAEPWRVDPTTNEQWYRLRTIAVAADDDFDDFDDPDEEDFDDAED